MKALTFKEKQDVLEDLFKKYHRAVLQLKCLEERNFYPSIQFDTVKEKKTYYQDKGSQLNDQLVLKRRIRESYCNIWIYLDCLSMESKVIIEKEFIERVVKIGGSIIILEVHTIVLKQGPWKKLCSI